MSDADPKEFSLHWTIPGDKNGQVTFEISGQVALFNDNKAYRIEGLLSVADGGMYCKEIGNPRMFVRRNGAEVSGRRWGWEEISRKKPSERLMKMEVYFVRTGYWAPSDRCILLDIGADSRITRRTKYSDTVEVRLVD